MRRLSLSIYLALIAHLLVFVVLLAVVWHLFDDDDGRRHVRGIAETLQEMLPGRDASGAELAGALARLRARFDVDLTVRDESGRVLASAGPVLPAGDRDRRHGWWRHEAEGRRGWAFVVTLPDGRRFSAARARPRGPRLLVPVLGFALLLALVAFPVARRITRRLERLQARVDQLGAGDLGARVEVEGRDEVARLAESFNRAAARIEELVGAQRTMLAAASHELRSPLARIRLAVELLESRPEPGLSEQVARDIAELDGLIEELLLASRLQSVGLDERAEPVDLLALVAEEAARTGASVEGRVAMVRGDARALRHLVRNLLENARRHGEPPVTVRVQGDEDEVVLLVRDHGAGIAKSEREAVFRPFYRPPGAIETGAGVGLGLSLVRQIARRHGGGARCLEPPDGGTVVEVRLPAAAPDPEPPRVDPL